MYFTGWIFVEFHLKIVLETWMPRKKSYPGFAEQNANYRAKVLSWSNCISYGSKIHNKVKRPANWLATQRSKNYIKERSFVRTIYISLQGSSPLPACSTSPWWGGRGATACRGPPRTASSPDAPRYTRCRGSWPRRTPPSAAGYPRCSWASTL